MLRFQPFKRASNALKLSNKIFTQGEAIPLATGGYAAHGGNRIDSHTGEQYTVVYGANHTSGKLRRVRDGYTVEAY